MTCLNATFLQNFFSHPALYVFQKFQDDRKGLQQMGKALRIQIFLQTSYIRLGSTFDHGIQSPSFLIMPDGSRQTFYYPAFD